MAEKCGCRRWPLLLTCAGILLAIFVGATIAPPFAPLNTRRAQQLQWTSLAELAAAANASARCEPAPALCRLQDVFDKIVVISLPRFSARVSRIVAQLDALHAPYTLLHARDATAASFEGGPANQRPGVRALWLTHVELLEYVLRAPLRNILIFEDDVTFASDFPVAFDALARALPPDWAALTLGQTIVESAAGPGVPRGVGPLITRSSVYELYGVFAVAFTRDAARVALDTMRALRDTHGNFLDEKPFLAVHDRFPERFLVAWPPVVAMNPFVGTTVGSSCPTAPAQWLRDNGVTARFDFHGVGYEGSGSALVLRDASCASADDARSGVYASSPAAAIAWVGGVSLQADSPRACCLLCSTVHPVCGSWLLFGNRCQLLSSRTAASVTELRARPAGGAVASAKGVAGMLSVVATPVSHVPRAGSVAGPLPTDPHLHGVLDSNDATCRDGAAYVADVDASQDLRSLNTDDAASCCRACASDGACAVWVWHTGSGCFLKGHAAVASARAPGSGLVAGRVRPAVAVVPPPAAAPRAEVEGAAPSTEDEGVAAAAGEAAAAPSEGVAAAARDAAAAPSGPVACSMSDGPSFWSLGLRVVTDKVTLPAGSTPSASHAYQFAYERYLRPVRCEPLALLEVGLGCDMIYARSASPTGHSVALWLEWLPRARISVFEYDAACARAFFRDDPLRLGAEFRERATLVTGDQSREADLLSAMRELGPQDVIIDDGGHSMLQQVTTLRVLLPFVKPGGVYILEDLHTSSSAREYTPYHDYGTLTTADYIAQLVLALHWPAHAGTLPEDAYPGLAALVPLVKSVDCHAAICIFSRWPVGEPGFDAPPLPAPLRAEERGAAFPDDVALVVSPPQSRVRDTNGPLVPLVPSPLFDQYLDLLAGFVTGSLTPTAGRCAGFTSSCPLDQLKPFDAEMRRGGMDWPPFALTMVGDLRIANVRMAIAAIVRDGVPGDFVELGVWRGGVCIFAKAMLAALGDTSRRVHLFDAFASIQAYYDASSYFATPLEAVRASFASLGLLDTRVVFHEGLFSVTVPAFAASTNAPIAILRLDGNFYSSHIEPLYLLYERVPVGGFVIFDDIRSHAEVQLAWAHFQEDQGFSEQLVDIPLPDAHSAWFRKSVAVTVDPSKRRATPAHVVVPDLLPVGVAPVDPLGSTDATCSEAAFVANTDAADPLRSLPAPDAVTCCRTCVADDACSAWVWLTGGACWLKGGSAVGSARPADSGLVAGRVRSVQSRK